MTQENVHSPPIHSGEPQGVSRANLAGWMGCGCVVAILFFAGLVSIASTVFQRSSRSPAETFLTAVKQGDTRHSYQLLAPPVRSAVAQADWTTTPTLQHVGLGSLVSWTEQTVHWTRNDGWSLDLVRAYDANFDDGAASITLRLNRTQGRWFVASFTVSTDGSHQDSP